MRLRRHSFLIASLVIGLLVLQVLGQKDKESVESNHNPKPYTPFVVCGPIFFAEEGFWSAALNEEHAACLDEIALKLQAVPHFRLVIEAHRDSNEPVGLSITRARHARRYLIEDKGTDKARIYIRNFSDTCPHESRDPNLNRRLEFWITTDDTTDEALNQFQRCAPGATPQLITTEKPAPWKGKWKSEALY